MQKHHRFGKYGEILTSLYYRFKLYSIVACRMRNHAGEIDLIVTRGKTIVFIEVKSRQVDVSHEYKLCSEKQMQRIRNAASLFIQRNPQYQSYDIRFDLVLVRPYSFPKVFYNI